MTRSLFAIALGAALTACAPRYTAVQADDTKEFGLVQLGGAMAYVIDPRTETCVLGSYGPGTAWAVTVSCAKLKANVPAAARFITWDASGGQ
jgi:hypothetical protein